VVIKRELELPIVFMSSHSPVILTVEDHDADAMLLQIAFDIADLNVCLFRARTAQEATSFLAKEHPFENGPKPDLIVLDVNLPGTNGIELLILLRSDPALATVPIAMLTSSPQARDRSNCLSLGAAQYVKKPLHLEELTAMAQSLYSLASPAPDLVVSESAFGPPN
jgi:DNA-binding response OmpR family regulator